MNGDRRTRPGHLRVVEVITVTDDNRDPTPDATLQAGRRSAADVAHLFEIAGREDEAIRLLDGCVAQLREVQQAKAALKTLPAADLRAALEFRRRALGGELA
jgi:hypothetical protein